MVRFIPCFADVAEEEGFKEIAAAFRMISVSEEQHEIRYGNLLQMLKKVKCLKRRKNNMEYQLWIYP